MHVTFIIKKKSIYFSRKTQIFLLNLVKKSVIIYTKYINYFNIFFLKSIIKLLNYISINNYAIDLSIETILTKFF